MSEYTLHLEIKIEPVPKKHLTFNGGTEKRKKKSSAEEFYISPHSESLLKNMIIKCKNDPNMTKVSSLDSTIKKSTYKMTLRNLQ